jgi:hypothetical protein
MPAFSRWYRLITHHLSPLLTGFHTDRTIKPSMGISSPFSPTGPARRRKTRVLKFGGSGEHLIGLVGDNDYRKAHRLYRSGFAILFLMMDSAKQKYFNGDRWAELKSERPSNNTAPKPFRSNSQQGTTILNSTLRSPNWWAKNRFGVALITKIHDSIRKKVAIKRRWSQAYRPCRKDGALFRDHQSFWFKLWAMKAPESPNLCAWRCDWAIVVIER